jgi:hypothetical protein
MSLLSPPRTFNNGYVFVEVFLRHPGYTRKSKRGAAIHFGRKTDWGSGLLTFKSSSMITGAPTNTNSRYRVSHAHELVRSYLMAKRRGHYHRWKESPAPLGSRISILCKHYRSSLRDCLPWPAINLRIEGTSALVAPSTRRIVNAVLHTDERIDREGCGARYWLPRCIRRGLFFNVEPSRTLTPCS